MDFDHLADSSGAGVMLVALLISLLGSTRSQQYRMLPDNLLLGVGSSAYQTEGAWNEFGKGESIWDTFTHSSPRLPQGDNGDVAAMSYALYENDTQLVKQLNVSFYRFSISWPRIFPTGFSASLNKEGADYYKNLIQGLLQQNITPVVTMYHMDLPQKLQLIGGWANPLLADYFEDYAYTLYSLYGDMVKWWITIDEPYDVAQAYSGTNGMAPDVKQPGIGSYLAIRTLLVAHARAYRLYENRFRQQQQGQVGTAFSCTWYEAASNSTEDEEAAILALQYRLGMQANPIYGSAGDYPEIVKQQVGNHSAEQGYLRSRLVPLTTDDINLIKGSSDFFGVSYFTTKLVQYTKSKMMNNTEDLQVIFSVNNSWPSSAVDDIKVVPSGLNKLLRWIKQEYNNPAIFITANGYPDNGILKDTDRIDYVVSHLYETVKAVHEAGCQVVAYTAWSLLDSFDWHYGYTVKYGLYYVNYSISTRPRQPKMSAQVYSDIATTRQLPINILETSGEVLTTEQSPVTQGHQQSAASPSAGSIPALVLITFVALLH